MIDPRLIAKVLKKSAELAQAVCAALVPLSLLGCGQQELQHLRAKDIEERVDNFYVSKNPIEELRIREISVGVPLEGFCVLSAYEDRATSDSDKLIAVNALLEKHQLAGQEDYWHLIVKTPDGFRVAKFNSAQIPLISPRPAYEGKNCVMARSIIFSKKVVAAGATPLLRGGPNTKIAINIQPGN